MAYDSGRMDANLAAAAGEDPVLMAELRAAFAQSVAQHVDLLSRARCDGNWEMAASRLRGLGHSFHSERLAQLAEDALSSAPGDPVALRKLREFEQDLQTR
ncbi:hypothetical protein [Paraurantiacibacter namhicola]|uniref:Hpt domain protein n=1 Tax=Paraurantiacibacter namhicola TaxID=645517 RepID=A0A1C7D9N7_9SPHN|nr:hypothetical protein [Paraurantiacibacter namhicola]ANU08082.1 hypothetical protein A6F65_01787 [Paraurantiacibacter namhicola]